MKITPVALNESSPRSSYEITFPAGIMWGLLACAATFGISIVSERVSGTLLRLKIAPLTSFQILAGKAAACFFACMLTLILLLGIAKIVFDIRILNISCLLLSIFSCSFAFVGIMMFISVLGSSQQAVSGAGWAIVCIMAMLGGGMVPLIAMPSWMLKLSHISPVKWGIYSLEGAIWRGFSFKEMLFPCCILVSSGIIFLTIGIILFSRQKL